MDKNSIRKLFIQKRNFLSQDSQVNASRVICELITNLSLYSQATNIGLYMAFNNEIDVNILWQDALSKNKQCYFPKVLNANLMIFLPVNNATNFSRNKWGILEPTTNEALSLSPTNLDLIIIPLVAFDKSGNRVGMGKGFYDRALANNNHTIKIGVGYDFQKVPLLKAETWDIKLDIIVTEKMVYSV